MLGGGSSRSSPPTSPRPTKDGSSRPKKQPPPARPPSPCTRPPTGSSADASCCRSCTARSCTRPSPARLTRARRRPGDRPRPPRPGAARDRVHPAPGSSSRRHPPHGGGWGHHDRGDHAPRPAAGRPRRRRVATLDTGHHISAGEARRLACAHRIVPAVLDGASVPLDLGRTRRLHTKANAWRWPNATGAAPPLRVRPTTRLVPGPPRPPWATGGHTDVTTGRLLCGHHHRRIHDPAYHHPHPARRHRRVPPTGVSRTPRDHESTAGPDVSTVRRFASTARHAASATRRAASAYARRPADGPDGTPGPLECRG